MGRVTGGAHNSQANGRELCLTACSGRGRRIEIVCLVLFYSYRSLCNCSWSGQLTQHASTPKYTTPLFRTISLVCCRAVDPSYVHLTSYPYVAIVDEDLYGKSRISRNPEKRKPVVGSNYHWTTMPIMHKGLRLVRGNFGRASFHFE